MVENQKKAPQPLDSSHRQRTPPASGLTRSLSFLTSACRSVNQHIKSSSFLIHNKKRALNGGWGDSITINNQSINQSTREFFMVQLLRKHFWILGQAVILHRILGPKKAKRPRK
jgi:starvation-inducible outer membrane lipoprotein